MNKPIHDWSNLANDYARLRTDEAVAKLYGCSKGAVWHARIKLGIKSVGATRTKTKSYQSALPPEQYATAVKFIKAMAVLSDHWKRKSKIDLRKLQTWFQSGEAVSVHASLEILSKSNSLARRSK